VQQDSPAPLPHKITIEIIRGSVVDRDMDAIVNALNPARRFYEALGGVHAREIKGVTYDDAGYGWDATAFARLIAEKT